MSTPTVEVMLSQSEAEHADALYGVLVVWLTESGFSCRRLPSRESARERAVEMANATPGRPIILFRPSSIITAETGAAHAPPVART